MKIFCNFFLKCCDIPQPIDYHYLSIYADTKFTWKKQDTPMDYLLFLFYNLTIFNLFLMLTGKRTNKA